MNGVGDYKESKGGNMPGINKLNSMYNILLSRRQLTGLISNAPPEHSVPEAKDPVKKYTIRRTAGKQAMGYRGRRNASPAK